MMYLILLSRIATRVFLLHQKLHTLLFVASSLILLCTVNHSALSQQATSKSSEKTTVRSATLSAEASQLLEQIKTRTAAYNTKFKNGVIEFSITISEPMNVRQQPDTKVLSYEDKGRWDITYQFDQDYQFYDVKADKKMELNGVTLPNWKKTHHQYLIMDETLHIWEEIGTQWKQHTPEKMPSILLEQEFNPHWWIWPIREFAKVIKVFRPTNVQSVKVEGIPHYLITLHRADPDLTRTIEIWIDSQKDYQATQILIHRREIQRIWDPQLRLGERLSLNRYIYQLEQFKPNIWYPQTTTLELLTIGANQPYRKITMNVHRAIFNTTLEQEPQQALPDN